MTAKTRVTGAARVIAAVFIVPIAGTAYAQCEATKVAPPVANDWGARAHEMRRLVHWHAFHNSVRWRMSKRGVVLCGRHLSIKRHERYRLDLVSEAWNRYGPLIRASAKLYRVPAELIIAVMVNESGLKPKAHQIYSGYISDEKTPQRISVGLGATLISTARYMLKDNSIDRDWLSDPANSIRIIGVYLDRHYKMNGFDPVRTAAAYNAGGIYRDASKGNRWRMRNYPLGHGIYIDHFVLVANQAMRFLEKRPDRPPESLASVFFGPPAQTVAVKVPDSWTTPSGGLVMYQAPEGTKMGVASSSIIDDVDAKPESSMQRAVCIPFLMACGDDTGQQPLFKLSR